MTSTSVRFTIDVVTLTVVFGLVATLGNAAAGEYRLVHGNRYALCREYDANLKSFPELTATTTEWPLNPRFKDFAKLPWQPVDAAQYIDVIKTIYTFQNDPLAKKTEDQITQIWDQHEKEVAEWIKNGKATLEKSDITIDSRKLIAYRYKHPQEIWGGRKVGKLIQLSYWYIFYDYATGAPISSYRFAAGAYFQMADSFLYKGRFYMISHATGQTVIEEPGFYAPENKLGVTAVCEFKYLE